MRTLRSTRMHRLLLAGAIALIPATLMAQPPSGTPAMAGPMGSGQNNGTSGPGGIDSSASGSAGADTQLMKDKMFVRKAQEGGFAQVQFGQLAVQKATSADVKKLGQRMVDDHTTLDSNMKPVADELGVRPATKMGKSDQEEYAKLNTLSGPDFDKEYLAYTLKGHRQTMRDFRTEENQTNDPDLKDVVANLEVVIVGHLYMVNKLAVANGVPGAYKPAASTLPPPPPPPPAPPQ